MVELIFKTGSPDYLLFRPESADEIDSLSLGILCNNHIDGLIMPIAEKSENTTTIRFDVSGRTPLSQAMGKPVKQQDLFRLFLSLTDAVRQAENYMLDPAQLLLKSDWIFLDKDTWNASLIYLPVERAHTEPPDFLSFFKNILYDCCLDPGESMVYISHLLTYLNQASAFSSDDFRDFLFEYHMADDNTTHTGPPCKRYEPRAEMPRADLPALPAIGSLASLLQHYDKFSAFLYRAQQSARKKYSRPGTSDNHAVSIDEVQFRCAAPMVLKPGKYFTAKIMMFREDDTDRADREARLIDDKVRAASSDVIEAEKGQEFTVGLQSPDLPELDAVKTIRWNGKYAARDFEILLPEDYAKDQLRLLGRIYSDHTPLTDISLILEVCGPAVQEVACEKVKLRTAFVSYASKDRAEVVKRIQGMEAARDDMDIFIDVEGLRRGEEYEPRLYQEIRDRDLFYLFWSRNAAASEWVGKELAYAVEHKPMTRIEPIALEAPEICPPPESLNKRHFRDWTLKYTT